MPRVRTFKGKLVNDMRIYSIWGGMKSRCYNKNAANYKYYGGRGIIMCDEWKCSFLNFYKWSLANGYKKSLTIDRIDVDGMYTPDNCRWVTVKVQLENKRSGIGFGEDHFRAKLTTDKVIHIRKQLLSNKEYSKMYGVSPSTISAIVSNYKRWPHAQP